jgi:hypothetical protein
MKERWCGRDFSCDEWVDPPGKRWEGFVRKADALFMAVDGVLELEMPGRTRRPAVGEEVFIPAGTVHSVSNVGGTAARWLYGHKRERRNPDACL